MGVDDETPFRELLGAMQSFGNGSKSGLRQANASFINLVHQMNNRLDPGPRHGTGPVEDRLDRTLKRTVPVVLQHAPTEFNRVVLAVIGWKIHQFNLRSRPVRKLRQAFHELRPRAVDFWPVVQIDLQPFYSCVVRSTLIPPLIQCVGAAMRSGSLSPAKHGEYADCSARCAVPRAAFE
jgi:hypothetical protein